MPYDFKIFETAKRAPMVTEPVAYWGASSPNLQDSQTSIDFSNLSIVLTR